MKCQEKVWYPTAVDAEEARRKMESKSRDKQRAKGLVVYHCRDCKKFHVGHLRASYGKPKAETPAPAPPKIPSIGDLKRKVRNLEKRLDAERRHAAYVIGKIVSKDREWLEAEAERARIEADRAKDMADTLAIAARLYGG